MGDLSLIGHAVTPVWRVLARAILERYHLQRHTHPGGIESFAVTACIFLTEGTPWRPLTVTGRLKEGGRRRTRVPLVPKRPPAAYPTGRGPTGRLQDITSHLSPEFIRLLGATIVNDADSTHLVIANECFPVIDGIPTPSVVIQMLQRVVPEGTVETIRPVPYKEHWAHSRTVTYDTMLITARCKA